MRSKRLTLVLGPFACVLLVLIFSGAITRDILRSSTSGETLALSTLRSGEEIRVTKVFHHRGPERIRQFLIGANGDSTRVVEFSISATWANGKLGIQPTSPRNTRTLSPEEVRRLDATVAYFRRIKEEHSSATSYYQLEYFRDGKRIGEELYVGFYLMNRLAYLERPGGKWRRADLDSLANDERLTPAELEGLLPFECLF